MKHIDSGEQILECYLAEASSRHPWKFHFSLMKSDFRLPQFRQFFGMWVGKLMWWIYWPRKVDNLDPFLRPFFYIHFLCCVWKNTNKHMPFYPVCQFFSQHFVVLVLSFILNKAGSSKRKKKNIKKERNMRQFISSVNATIQMLVYLSTGEKKRKMLRFENQITWPPKGLQGVDLSEQTNE